MRFLFRAQDNNMTNGDFAFFSYASGLSSRTYQPWDRYVDDPNELPYRQRAYYALKQVSLMPVETLIRLLVVCLLQYSAPTSTGHSISHLSSTQTHPRRAVSYMDIPVHHRY